MTSLFEPMPGPTPALLIEVNPPRGSLPAPLLEQLAPLIGHVDAVNLTDNAMTKVKLSGLVFAGFLKQRLKLPVVLNCSCRDRNLLALKADLLGAAALGIEGIVALTGDKLVDAPGGAHAVHDVDVFGLLQVVGELNRGETGDGKGRLKTPPRLLAGAVANPNRLNQARERELLARKVAAGARFVITQPVFDYERAADFLTAVRPLGVPVILGLLPVKHAQMAVYLSENVNELKGLHEHFARYRGLSDGASRELSLTHSLELMKSLSGQAAGFNVMSGGGPSLAIELCLSFDRQRRGL